MKRQVPSTVRFAAGTTIPVAVFAALAMFSLLGRCGYATDEFQDFVNQIPRSANAVVLLNLEKAKNSPLGLKENWKRKIEDTFACWGSPRAAAGRTVRWLLRSTLSSWSLSGKSRSWTLTKNSSGTVGEVAWRHVDKIEGLPALALPNDTYLVQLGPKMLGAMRRRNRQAVVRWIRDSPQTIPTAAFLYLQKAAVYSDKTGSEIIMALDLDGVMSFERVVKFLKSHKKAAGCVAGQ